MDRRRRSSSNARHAGRRVTPSFVLVASYVAVSIAGCSSSGLVQEGGRSGPPAFDVTAFAGQYCDSVGMCCTQGRLPVAPSACREFVASLAPTWNLTAAASCLAETQAAEAQPDFCGPSGVTYLPSCVALFKAPSKGTAGLGEACSYPSDCAPSSVGTVACPGKRCAILAVGTKGDGPCTATLDHGSVGFSSSAVTATWASTVFSCDLADGVFCPILSGPEPRRCTAISDVGGPCSTGEEYQCTKGSFCNWGVNTCKSLPVVGEPCAGILCAAGLHCDSTHGASVCAPSAPLGSSCATDETCASGVCSSGRCVAEGNPGMRLVCGGF